MLAAELRGARDEAVEIIAEPMLMKSYGVSLDQLIAVTQASNSLVAAGALEGATGRFAVKVPALIEKPEDMLQIPIAASAGAVVTLGDVAQVRPTFKDATSITRVNGKPAITIEVSKRTGANLIETVDQVKKVIEQLQQTWPEALQVAFTQDKSKVIRQMLPDLQNSVITGVLLVAIIMLFVLGGRASLFIGIAIPASFLAGMLGLQLAGLTVNIVVLFSLILAVGMLVDDAIIVSEFAERRMAEGMQPREAYSLAAKRMAGPVIAATATRVAAFSPLLFWPGIVGEFMKYMPITLIATLSASLVVALFFTPTLGALLGRAAPVPQDERAKDRGLYMRTVQLALRHPGMTLVLAVALLVGVQMAYGKFGKRRRVLPQGRARLRPGRHPRARQPLDRREGPPGAPGRGARAEVRRAPDRLCPRRRAAAPVERDQRGHDRHDPVRVRRLAGPPAGARDHGRDPRQDRGHSRRHRRGDGAARRPADRQAGARPALRARSGPAARRRQEGRGDAGAAHRRARRRRRPAAARHRLALEVNKAEAAKYEANVNTVGTGVQLVTNGVKVTEYRPSDNDKSVDILVRFPPERRSLDQIDELRIKTPAGHVPIGNFVTRVPAPRVGNINRIGGARVITVTSNVAEGVQSANVQKAIAAELAKTDLGQNVTFRLKGEDEEREKAGAFLMKAFGAAMFLIFAILLAQFNKFISVVLWCSPPWSSRPSAC